MSAYRRLTTRAAAVFVMLLLLGNLAVSCQGKGVRAVRGLSMSIQGLPALNYNGIVPVNILIQSGYPVYGKLAIGFRTDPASPFRPASAVPGKVDPRTLSRILVNPDSTTIVFWWHVVADLKQGEKHDSVFLQVTFNLDSGESVTAFAGPVTFDYRDIPGFGTPPLAESGPLPATRCGENYWAHLSSRGGYQPVVWSLWPPGTQLPSFLELTHDGWVRGIIPGDYGPATVTFTAMVTDSNPSLQRQSVGQFSIFIDCEKVVPCAPPPEILFTSIPVATETQSYFFQATAAGGEGALEWDVLGSLPPGFDFTSSGLLTGTPQVGTAGQYSFTLRVCDSCHLGAQCDTVSVTLTIAPKPIDCGAPPNILTQVLANAREGNDYTRTLESQGGYGQLTWTVIQGSLPSGISLTGGGVLHGIPGPGTGGKDYNFTVQLCDSCPQGARCDTQALKLHVDLPPEPCGPAPEITSPSPLPTAYIGTFYSYQFTATGGKQPLTWQITNPQVLPNGITFNQQGVLSGTADPGMQGTYELHIKVTDSCETPQSDSGAFIFNVQPAPCADPPEIVNTPLPDGREGEAYDFTLSAVNGEGTLTWAQVGGPSLPAGLVLESTGQIHGTPQTGTAGTYTALEFQVSDSCPNGSQSDSNLFNLTILPAASGCADPPEITTTALPYGGEGLAYNFQLAAVNGEGTLTWTVLSDNDQLPPQLVLSSDGTISGTPDTGTAGVYNIHFQVCDSCDPVQCDDAVIQLEIKAPCAPGPEITTASLPVATVGAPYSFQFEATGGEGIVHWALEDMGALPVGWFFSPTGILSGNPSPDQVGQYFITVIASDSCYFGEQSDQKDFTLEIQN